MNISQITIGTASWGSKINLNKSLEISSKVISLGINHFDTAPNYGGGYAHYILNKIAKKNNILIDTKYGQNINLTAKEIFKRFYRFTNIGSLKQSFKHIKFYRSSRSIKEYWSLEKLEAAFSSFQRELNNCTIMSFYLHSPPFGILNKEYLDKLYSFFDKKKILLGISNPDKKDLNLIIKQFPHIKIQLSINDFWNLKEQLDQRFKNVNINSIFRKLIKETNDNKNDSVKFWKDFFKIVEGNSNYRLVLGINSINSVEKLKKIICNSDNISHCQI